MRPVNQKAQEVLVKRQKEQKELAIAFQKALGNQNGKLVLEGLEKFTKSNIVVIPTDSTGMTDPYEMARNDGKRSVMVYINSQLNKTFNQEEQKKAEL